jgi:protein-L-isoaspartate O-methyltransferase
MEEMSDFYESEVPQYEAVESYAGPFDSALYLGSGFDRTPAETLDAEVRHVDHDPTAVEFLERKGYEAVEEDVTEYNPEENFDLVILSHLPTQEPPIVSENLSHGGAMVCRTKGRARKLQEREELDLQAAYENSRMTEHSNLVSTPRETELYLFTENF